MVTGRAIVREDLDPFSFAEESTPERYFSSVRSICIDSRKIISKLNKRRTVRNGDNVEANRNHRLCCESACRSTPNGKRRPTPNRPEQFEICTNEFDALRPEQCAAISLRTADSTANEPNFSSRFVSNRYYLRLSSRMFSSNQFVRRQNDAILSEGANRTAGWNVFLS